MSTLRYVLLWQPHLWAKRLMLGLLIHPPYPKKKPSIAFGDLNDVTLGSSAIFENQSLTEAPEKARKPDQQQLHTRPVAFRPHLSMGLVLPNVVFSSPQAKASGRQRWGILR